MSDSPGLFRCMNVSRMTTRYCVFLSVLLFGETDLKQKGSEMTWVTATNDLDELPNFLLSRWLMDRPGLPTLDVAHLLWVAPWQPAVLVAMVMLMAPQPHTPPLT